MSWKFAGINFGADYGPSYPALLDRLGVDYFRTAEGYSFAAAIQHDNRGTALGVVNRRTLLLNHLLPYDCSYEPRKEGLLDEKLGPLSVEADILNYIFDGVSGTYCFSLFRQGERVRRWAAEPGKTWVDEGRPSDVEKAGRPKRLAPDSPLAGAFDTKEDEARLFAVWEDFLGIAFQDLIRNEAPLFQVFS